MMDHKKQSELLVGTLIEKGYNGMMMSESSIGKLGEVVEDYLRERNTGKHGKPEDLWISTYLRWNGEDKPHVVCDMWININHSKITVDHMIILQNSEYGILIKKCELKNLSLELVPTVQKAIELVNEALEKKMIPGKRKRFGL